MTLRATLAYDIAVVRSVAVFNLCAEIFFPKYFRELQNARKYHNNIKSASFDLNRSSFLKEIVISFNFFTKFWHLIKF